MKTFVLKLKNKNSYLNVRRVPLDCPSSIKTVKDGLTNESDSNTTILLGWYFMTLKSITYSPENTHHINIYL